MPDFLLDTTRSSATTITYSRTSAPFACPSNSLGSPSTHMKVAHHMALDPAVRFFPPLFPSPPRAFTPLPPPYTEPRTKLHLDAF